jgi:beta-carotene hydroxylase
VLAGKPIPFRYKMPFSDRVVRALCWFNLASSLFWLGIYAACVAYDPRLALAFLLPATVGLFLSAAQSYLDHGGIVSDRRWENTRTRTSRWATLMWYGNNYHLEHHLYPGIPAYWLPRVHRILRDQGVFERVNAEIDPHFWRPYRNVAADYLPSAMEDPSFDPNPSELRGRSDTATQAAEALS